jgi:hypothetical protein
VPNVDDLNEQFFGARLRELDGIGLSRQLTGYRRSPLLRNILNAAYER